MRKSLVKVAEIDSKTQKSTLEVCGLEPCHFVFILESITPPVLHETGACTTVLKPVDWRETRCGVAW